MNNLIGLSGKKGVGKDLVYDIINYLTYCKNNPEHTEEFEVWLESASPFELTYENKKFADKLKDIACLLIGCTREQLESRTFKETSLGKNWTCWEVRPLSLEPRLFITQQKANTYADKFSWAEVKLRTMTPRLLLQLLGTECGRQVIHPEIWVNALFADYETNYLNTPTEKVRGGYMEVSKWIITDVRFPNEVKAIEDRGGMIIRIERPGIELGTHASETALDDHVFKHTIINDGTIEDLVQKVKHVLNL